MEIEKKEASGADSRRLILPLATTLAVRLRFKLVAALWRLPERFFDGLALLFDHFGLPVGFSLSMGGGVCLLFGMMGISTRIVFSPWRKPPLTLLLLLFLDGLVCTDGYGLPAVFAMRSP